MRIAFIWGSGGPKSWNDANLESGIGGSEAMMILYARALAKRGHQVTCLCPNDTPGWYHGVYWDNLYHRDKDFDAVISLRSPEPLYAYSNVLVRALFANDQRCDRLPLAVRDNACNMVITISQHQTERYQALYPDIPASHWFMSSAGVEAAAYRPLPKHHGLCLYTSTPERGLEHLITLWPIIHQECPWATLKITSGFQLYGASDEMAARLSGGVYEKLTAIPGVEYLGPIPRSQLQQLQMSAELLLYPTTYDEMCCISALEASAAEMAIVTTNRGALSERVGRGINGYLIDGHPSESLYQAQFVQAAIRILKDQNLQRFLGIQGKGRAAKHDYAILAEQWEAELNGRR